MLTHFWHYVYLKFQFHCQISGRSEVAIGPAMIDPTARGELKVFARGGSPPQEWNGTAIHGTRYQEPYTWILLGVTNDLVLSI